MSLTTFYPKCGFSWWLSGKELPAKIGDMSLNPELRRSPGEGNGNPLQYSCLENPMDRGAWDYSPWGSRRVGHDLTTKQQQLSKLWYSFIIKCQYLCYYYLISL